MCGGAISSEGSAEKPGTCKSEPGTSVNGKGGSTQSTVEPMETEEKQTCKKPNCGINCTI